MIARTLVIARREFAAYFATPLAAVFLVIFLFLAGLFTFNIGSFYERGQADLRPFFQFHPWLFLFLVPAVSMRLWAEERRTGTIELLTTLPFRLGELVVGKFLAAWGFTLVALALTLPTWITVNWLGEPDNGVILCGYVGSALMAGAFLAVGACISSTSKSQVIAFVSCVVACFLLLLTGFPLRFCGMPLLLSSSDTNFTITFRQNPNRRSLSQVPTSSITSLTPTKTNFPTKRKT
jgi:ABC-2 type transport system permease protein